MTTFNPITLSSHYNKPEILLALKTIARVNESMASDGNFYLSCTLELNGVDITLFSTHYEKRKLAPTRTDSEEESA